MKALKTYIYFKEQLMQLHACELHSEDHDVQLFSWSGKSDSSIKFMVHKNAKINHCNTQE